MKWVTREGAQCLMPVLPERGAQLAGFIGTTPAQEG